MPSPSIIGRFSRYSVPVAIFLIVLVTVLVVPPLAMSGVTARTYAITGAVIISPPRRKPRRKRRGGSRHGTVQLLSLAGMTPNRESY